MRSVRQASGALDELAKLMPDTAERITEQGIPRKYPFPNSAKTMSYSSVRARACLPTAKSSRRVVRRRVDDHGRVRPLTKRRSGGSSPGRSTKTEVSASKSRRRARATLAGIMRLVDEAQKSKSRTSCSQTAQLAGCSTWHSASRRLRPSRGSSPRGSTSVFSNA